jgi:hypothetical protein
MPGESPIPSPEWAFGSLKSRALSPRLPKNRWKPSNVELLLHQKPR